MSDEEDNSAADARPSAVLDGVLRELPSARLDSAVATRVLALAKVHLEPAVVDAPPRVRFALAQALIPALLGTVVIDHVAETVTAVDVAYGKGSQDQVPPL